MSLYAQYTIGRDDIYMVVTVNWYLDPEGAIVHTDTFRYNLADPTTTQGGADRLTSRIRNDVKSRATLILKGAEAYTAVEQRLGTEQGVIFQILP